MIEEHIEDIINCMEVEAFYYNKASLDCGDPVPGIRYVETECTEYQKQINGSNSTRTYERLRFELHLYAKAPTDCPATKILEQSKQEIEKLKELAGAMMEAFFSGEYGVVNSRNKLMPFKKLPGIGNGMSKKPYPLPSKECNFVKLVVAQTIEFKKGCNPCIKRLYFPKFKFSSNTKGTTLEG